jgi:hypothetical protein
MPGARTSRGAASTRAEGARQHGWLIVWAIVAALVMAAVAQWINTGKAPDYINQEKAQ